MWRDKVILALFDTGRVKNRQHLAIDNPRYVTAGGREPFHEKPITVQDVHLDEFRIDRDYHDIE